MATAQAEQPTSKIRTYRGVNIHPHVRNSMGFRYWALVPGYRMVQADTLDGIKRAIRAGLTNN